ncbi:MAG: ribosomal protein S18-alanine N-acetyltransferase [Anaerolineae bacterium]
MWLPPITPMTVDDLDAIMALERVCFKDPWTRRMYLTDLTENDLATYLVVRPPAAPGHIPLREAGPASWPAILAYGGFWLMVDEAHIATIATHPDWRGCGLGLYLMLGLLDAAMARGARISTLEVRASNSAAQNLYLKLGYEIVGRRRRYYRDGEDALLMTTPPLAEAAMQERLARARDEALARIARCLGHVS